MLSSKMRDVMIDHLDGRAVPIIRISELSGVEASRAADRHITTRALLLRGFLKPNSNQTKNPVYTLITEKGRAELCALLGEYADAILRARFELPPRGDEAPPTSRSLAENRVAHRRGWTLPVDIPAADAHLGMDYFTPATEGASDGDPTEAG